MRQRLGEAVGAPLNLVANEGHRKIVVGEGDARVGMGLVLTRERILLAGHGAGGPARLDQTVLVRAAEDPAREVEPVVVDTLKVVRGRQVQPQAEPAIEGVVDHQVVEELVALASVAEGRLLQRLGDQGGQGVPIVTDLGEDPPRLRTGGLEVGPVESNLVERTPHHGRSLPRRNCVNPCVQARASY